MELVIDAQEIASLASHSAAAPGIIRDELTTSLNAAAAEGVGLAADFAPVDVGTLQGSITILEPAHGDTEIIVVYGSNLIYAAQREWGGIIRARNGRYLVFEINGVTFFVEQVQQEGSHYMEQSMESLGPRLPAIIGAAIERATVRIYGG